MKRVLFSCITLWALAGFASAQDHHLKIRLAVAPIDWSMAESWNIPQGFQTAIYEKLVKKLLDTGRFTVLEREALDALMKEQAIKQDNTGESQKGKVVPAQAMVQGKVSDFRVNDRGASGGISVGGIHVGGGVKEALVGINVRLFDVDTSEILASETATGTSNGGGVSVGMNIGNTYSDFNAFQNSPLGKATTTAIDKTVELVLKKMEKQPWSCKVADYDSSAKEVAINAGTESGLRVGDTFDVSRVTKVIKDPDTGQVLGKRTQKVGAVTVTRVEKKVAFCSVSEGDGFQVGDTITEPHRG